MTTPRDAIAGLSERLRRGGAVFILPGCVSAAMSEAATQLDALLKERDALQARVKELEDGRNFWKSERDRIKAFLSEGDWQTVKSEQAWRNRALRAEQERDEAYERLKPFAECAADIPPDHDQHGVRCCYLTFADLRAARDLVRRLAGPEKEKS